VSTEGGTRWVCGTLGKTHGLGGELYLNLAPGGLEYLSDGARHFVADERSQEDLPCVARRAGGSDARPLVALDLATTREEALALQGRTLLASGGPLDKLPHYRAGDLIGREVREDGSGATVGEVVDVIAAPAHEILELRPPGGGRAVLVPLVEELVWEGPRGWLVVRAGLLTLDENGAAEAEGAAEGRSAAVAEGDA